MLNIIEAAEQLCSSGISANEQDVWRWIQEGTLKAEMSQRRKLTYKINVKDLMEFIIKRQTEDVMAQLEQSRSENRKLIDQLEVSKTRLQIEQSKVRTLKKMLNAQIEVTASNAFHFEHLLGLNEDTNNLMLKKEFKKLLKALHPDRGGDERLFKVFNEHYERLK
jgi:hypothetical protein